MTVTTGMPTRVGTPRLGRTAAAKVVLALGAALVLVIASVALLNQSAPSETAVASALRSTAAQIDEHAGAMIDHGQRLAAAARAGNGPQRDHWISDGEHMVSDGIGLQALAKQLRQDATYLGEAPLQRAGIDLDMIRTEATVLKADGEAAVGHGRAMVEHGALMAQLSRQPGSGITEADASLMSADAARIVDAGESTVRMASMLQSAVDRYSRSLGVFR